MTIKTPTLVRLWTEAAAKLTTEIHTRKANRRGLRLLILFGVLRDRLARKGGHARVLRRAWYRLFGLPELRAQVWLYPRAPLLRRLRGDRDLLVSTVELPADLTREERARLVADLHEIANHMSGDNRP